MMVAARGRSRFVLVFLSSFPVLHDGRYLFDEPTVASSRAPPVGKLCGEMELDADACGRVAFYLDARIGTEDVEDIARVSAPFSYPNGSREEKRLRLDTVVASSAHDWIVEGVCKQVARCHKDAFCAYCEDMQRHLQSTASRWRDAPAGLLTMFGDVVPMPCFPTLVKTRPTEARTGNSVLFNVESRRHWESVERVADVDVPFSEKEDRLVWRGASTGNCHRVGGSGPVVKTQGRVDGRYINATRSALVSRWWNSTDDPRIDIGFSEITPHCAWAWASKGELMRSKMSMKELLGFKFLLVVNGNDIASSTQWVLQSNSVPFMVPPNIESWLQESLLEPWVHYVPLAADFSDLRAKLDWAVANPKECESVARAGTAYMARFADAEREQRIGNAVITAYLQRTRVSDSAAPYLESADSTRLQADCAVGDNGPARAACGLAGCDTRVQQHFAAVTALDDPSPLEQAQKGTGAASQEMSRETSAGAGSTYSEGSNGCEVPRFTGDYSSLDAFATAVPGLEPVRIEPWMIEATRVRVSGLHVDTQLQCAVVGDGVMKRLLAPNVILAGHSRSGTTSLDASLKYKIFPSANRRRLEGTPEEERRRRLEGMFFKASYQNIPEPYTQYLLRAYSKVKGPERPIPVNCTDARYKCGAGAVESVVYRDRKAYPSRTFFDKTPNYHSVVEAMLTIHFANPTARILLSTREPWNYVARVEPSKREQFISNAWRIYHGYLRAADCPLTVAEDLARWRANGCSFIASSFDLKGKGNASGAWSSIDEPRSYFKLVHYVYSVELFHRLFGEANVLVLRFERCLGADTCGPQLAAFVGVDASLINADPYAEFKNVGKGHTHTEEHRNKTAHLRDEHVNATIRALGFSAEMVEDLLSHERLLHKLLGWAWPWDGAAPDVVESNPTESVAGGL